jgi:hypothetical protein
VCSSRRLFLDLSGEAACVIWGRLDAPKFKDCILPLVFLKPSGSLSRITNSSASW